MKRLLLGLLLALMLTPATSFAAYQALGKAEDAAHSDGDYGIMSLCVRKDTSTTGIGANGDYVPCAVNASGYMYTTADVTAVVPGTGASSLGKAEDAAHGSGDTGVFVMGRRIDTAAASSGTSGDYEAFNMDSFGRLWVNPGVIGIEDAAETAGGNLAMAGTVRRDTAASSAGTTGDNATLNTDATGRLWTNTELPDASSTPNGGTYAAPTAPDVYAFLMCKNGSTWDPCISSGNYVEDAASAGAEQVIMAGGVRQDTLASNTSADGDYTYNKYTAAGRLYTSATIDAALPAGPNNIGDVDAIQSGTWTVQPGNTANTTPWLTTIHQGGNAAVVNGSGQLSVTCANCSGSGASFVDDAAFTVGTSSGAPAMGMLDETTPDTVNEGDVGVVRMSANRNMYVQLRDNAGNERGLNIDASGNITANITGTVTVGSHAVTNAGTFAVQVDGAALTALQLIDDIVGVEDAAETAGAGLARMGSVRRDTAASSAGTDGDNATINTDATGRLWTHVGTIDGGTITTITNAVTVTAANLDVQSGGADLATEATAAGILTSANFAAAFGTAGTADTQVMSVQGIASMTPILANPGTAANWGVYVEDAGETAGGNLLMAGTVRRDVAASSAGTTGDNATANTDALGLLWTRKLDPCSGVAKTHIPINVSTATTTELTPSLAGASTHYYVCSIDLVTAAANNVALADDDTDNCASVTSGLAGGTTAASGWNFAANGGLTKGNGDSTVFKTGGTNRVLCLVTSAATQLSGSIQVVTAP